MIALSGPLRGVKIVEMSNMVTASLAAMTLGGQGAEVVKVEPLGIGDKLRYFGTQKSGISGVFNNCNRGKRSLAINLKSEDGLEAVRKLILEADILIHNYRPGVMRKLGLNSETLRAQKPNLIVCSLTGFGREGPMKDAPAFDHVIQALSGLTGAQGRDGKYEFIRQLVCDKITAYTAAQAVTAALFQAARTGKGQHINISMLQASLAFLWPDAMMHATLLGEDVLHQEPMKAFYQTLKTADGMIAVAPFGDAAWAEVFRILDRDDMAANPNYQGLFTRGKNVSALLADLAGRPTAMTSQELLAQLSAADVPCAPCLSDNDLLVDAQILAVDALEVQDHPALGPVRMARNPVRFGGVAAPSLGPSPLLGEHTETVLADLGYDAAEVAALRDAHVIG